MCTVLSFSQMAFVTKGPTFTPFHGLVNKNGSSSSYQNLDVILNFFLIKSNS